MANRRRQIVDAAVELVAEKGVEALSVRGVAVRAGIGASTLRHYFPTQRDLYDEVVGATFDLQLDDLRIHDSTVPAELRLTECLGQFLPENDDQRPQLEGWFGFYISAVGPTRTEQGARLLATFSQRARERVEGWLAILASEKALPRTDVPRVATTALAVINGLCLELLTPQTTQTVSDAHNALERTIRALITSSDATNAPDQFTPCAPRAERRSAESS